jgi:hypothetical protein
MSQPDKLDPSEVLDCKAEQSNPTKTSWMEYLLLVSALLSFFGFGALVYALFSLLGIGN